MRNWPERLLIAAVRFMPRQRKEWGEAMLAELASVQPFKARWHFAIGCASVVLEEFMKTLTKRAWRTRLLGTRVFGVAWMSLIWASLWGLMFGLLLLVLERVLGPSSEPSLLFMVWTISQVGLVTGVLFGVLLAWAENGKAVADLSLLRVTFWGALSAAVFPVLTGRANQVFWTCTFGVIVAVGIVALAKRATHSHPTRMPSWLRLFALLAVKSAVHPR